jgi:TonB family protein
VALLRPNGLLANFIVLSAGLLFCQVTTPQVPGTVPRRSPTAAVDAARASLDRELDRAIVVLKRGLKEHWATRDQYLTAFEKTSGTDSAGRSARDAESYVECKIGEHLPTHKVWDEKWDHETSINVAVQRTIDEFIAMREGQFLESPTSCAAPAPKKVIVSAGVAASLLKSRIDPAYPPIVGSFPTDGTVVLRATISTKGIVEALSVIGGPASLQQAAMDAARHWTYRPYMLNNKPVEVETTINVIFMRHR